MTSWVITIDATTPDHWEFAKHSALWDFKKSNGITSGDHLYFWLNMTGLIGHAIAVSDTFLYSEDDGPWRDAGRGVYTHRVLILGLDDDPERRLRWTEIQSESGLESGLKRGITSGLNRSVVNVEDPGAERYLRSLFPSSQGIDFNVGPPNISTFIDEDWLSDQRKFITREAVYRQGQQRFKRALLGAYRGKCAISSAQDTAVLEAAHIASYRGDQSDVIPNGILLRSDLHALFDAKLLTVTPQFYVHVSPELVSPDYRKLNESTLSLPQRRADRPDATLLSLHNDRCAWLQRARR